MNEQSQLLSLLNDAFSTQEIRGLLIDLGEDPDSFAAPDAGRDKLAQETVLHFKRRKQLPILAAGMARARPDLAEDLASVVSPDVAVGGLVARGETRPWMRTIGLILVALLLLGLFGAFAVYAFAPLGNEPFEMVVRVQDAQTNLPVERAEVTLLLTGSAPRVVFTDSGGTAVLSVPGEREGETARLSIQRDGYEVYERNVTLGKANTAVEIRLTPSP